VPVARSGRTWEPLRIILLRQRDRTRKPGAGVDAPVPDPLPLMAHRTGRNSISPCSIGGPQDWSFEERTTRQTGGKCTGAFDLIGLTRKDTLGDACNPEPSSAGSGSLLLRRFHSSAYPNGIFALSSPQPLIPPVSPMNLIVASNGNGLLQRAAISASLPV
jgi:hypothetical protein